MLKKYIAVAAVFGAIGVALGAFGAHGLKKITEDEKILQGYQTGVQYQMYHVFALLAVAFLSEKISNKFLKWSANCFVAGILLFSGSLYLITILKIQESSAVKFAGPITPVGGIFFIAGWVFLFLSVIGKKKL